MSVQAAQPVGSAIGQTSRHLSRYSTVSRPPRAARVATTCRAAPGEEQPLARRSALLAGVAAAALSLQSRSALAMWDGESSAIGSCPLDESGNECRQRILQKDSKRLASYSDAANNSSKVGGKQTGVPVADLSAAYIKETQSIAAKLKQYLQADPYDEARVKLAKELKAEGPAWTSRYARGGSARSVSARKMYVAVDAVAGHLANNGLAPFPAAKASKLVATIDESLAVLAEGR